MFLYSFLGLGKHNKVTGSYEYERVKYGYKGTIIETNYFPYVAYKFTNPEKVTLILTEESYTAHSLKLKDLFDFEPIIIPTGKDEKEIWEIFGTIADCIPERCNITLDITHGFRSQPIIGIASLLYLKTSKNINVNKILYGAYEARTNDIVPVFDLSPFITLIEWSNAANEFIKHANAKEFSGLLLNIHNSTYRNNLEHKAESLKSIGKILIELTDALSIVSTQDILNKSSHLPDKVEGLCNDLSQHIETRPLSLVLKNISDKIEPISTAENELFNTKGINAQLCIIEWYLETANYQQAITLICEFLISLFALRTGKDPLNERKNTVVYIGNLIELFKTNKLNQGCSDYRWALLYNQISETRNEINHAGMKKAITSSKVLIKKICKHFEDLKKLKADYNL